MSHIPAKKRLREFKSQTTGISTLTHERWIIGMQGCEEAKVWVDPTLFQIKARARPEPES